MSRKTPSRKALLLTLALAGALISGPALAKDEAGVAKLTGRVAAKVRIVADHAVWTCVEGSCAAVLTDRATVRGCRELARKVGPLTAYGRDSSPLSAEDLAACNAAAAPAPQQSAAAD